MKQGLRVNHKARQMQSLNLHPRKKDKLPLSNRSVDEVPVPSNKNNNSKIKMSAKLAVITEMQADHKILVLAQTKTTHKIKAKTIKIIKMLPIKELEIMSRKISRMT